MYDLVIIGAGWAGFNAALKAKQLGLKVALIDKSEIGGTCLNRGCIPTKTLLQSAKVYSLVKKSKNFGIETAEPKINFSEVVARKNKIVQQLQQGMKLMLKDIDFFNSEAILIAKDTVKAGDAELKTRFILIATGSKPYELPGFKFDGKKILSSDDILNLVEIPSNLLIIGGGVIGCEFASLFSALGVKVTIVEKMPQLLPGEDKEVARKLENILKKKGINISTNTDAAGVNTNDYDLVLVCVGRAANSNLTGLDKLGIKTENNKIAVDGYLRTNIPNVYAAGDCTGKIMLAHFAAYQGITVAENIANPDKPKKADNCNVPNCIFTDPEVASVGLNEDKTLAQGIEVKINKFDFLASGMARIIDETEGFIKIISDKNTEEVIGASIIGPKATELIGILTLAVNNKLKISQIRETIFAHPTIAESIHETLK